MVSLSTVSARGKRGPSGNGRKIGPRPRRVFTVRRVVRGVGKTLIAIGILLFLFVAYELWGTGFAERRSQKALRAQFARTLRTTTTVGPGSTAAPPDSEPPVDLGNSLGLISIAKIGVNKAIVQGVGVEDLKQGPGHYPDTPLPGQPGNAAIAGHRTTYGAPFNRLDELSPGDPIIVTTAAGKFRYEVDHSRVVSPSEVSVLDPTPDNRLTLTTCNPKFSASQRLIIVARLVSPVTEPPPTTPRAAPAVSSQPHQLAGLSGRGAARGPVIAWGMLAAIVWGFTWWVGQRWRRWLAYLIGAPVFLVILFVFFENVSRLLPANV